MQLVLFRFIKKITLLFCFLSILNAKAQLGFCNGNSGDPIFEENFGTGKIDIPLAYGRTSYKFTKRVPNDGFYKVSGNTNYWGWFNVQDHTPNDKNGRCLIVNASHEPGEFFRIPVSGLCENTTYQFTSWLINLFPYNNKICGPFGNQVAKPINVTFEIWDSTDTKKLSTGNTGDIIGSVAPNWNQYGLVFKTKPGQTSVILKMRNNGKGGCGNDLAIDDILFRTCGDSVFIEDLLKNTNSASIYQNELPFSTELKAIPDFSVFSKHFYQWQKSNDGYSWHNLKGENSNTLSIKNITDTCYYRVLVAENDSNLLNSSCNLISNVYKVNILDSNNPISTPRKPRVIQKKVGVSLKSPRKILIEEPRFNMIKPAIPMENGIKTVKRVIVVMDGVKIIYGKVWIDGAIGKFVQTSEEIIKQGDANAGVIVEETIYKKARYDYNSTKRTYTIFE